MATDVTLPDLGEEVEDVTISRWLVKEGEDIRAGDPLLEIATDKVDTEVPAPVGGRVLSIRFGEGEIVDLDAVIAVIGEATEATEPAPEDSGAEYAPDQSGPGAGKDGPAQSQTGDTQEDHGAAVRATPVARRMAEEAGIALSAVQSGDGEQITKSDVEAALREKLRTGQKEPQRGARGGAQTRGRNRLLPTVRWCPWKYAGWQRHMTSICERWPGGARLAA